jgi:hypothetical protein
VPGRSEQELRNKMEKRMIFGIERQLDDMDMGQERKCGKCDCYTESDPLEPISAWCIDGNGIFTERVAEPGCCDYKDRVEVEREHRELIECDRTKIKASYRK